MRINHLRQSKSHKNELTIYENFLISEFNNISQAHFNTINSISAFFKHYLLIISVPYTIFALVMKIPTQTGTIQNSLNLPPIVLIIIASLLFILGFCIMIYILNLQFDALLYARTVNGIRKYFYENSGLKISEELRYRVLSRSIFIPLFNHNFLGVIIVFSILDCSYLFFSLWWYLCQTIIPNTISNYIIILFHLKQCWIGFLPNLIIVVLLLLVLVLSLFLHIAVFKYKASLVETGISKKWIGIDIDGVVNLQREQFSNILKTMTGKVINPEAIVKIPVSNCQELGVSEEEEIAVFNNPKYWIDMPTRKDAVQYIKQISNLFNIRVVLFTDRPWPIPQKNKDYTCWFEKAKFYFHWIKSSKHLSIKGVTKAWLKKEGISVNKLIINKSNTERRTLFNSKNRYEISKNMKVFFFVEDNLINAIRLADICEIVFLIDYPYNRDHNIKMPYNIIRVRSWKEIFEFIRDKVNY